MIGGGISHSLLRQFAEFGKTKDWSLTPSVDPPVDHARLNKQTWSDDRARFASLLLQSDEMLIKAERVDLEDCVRILAAHCAHYRSKFGDIPMSETLDVITSGAMNDEQAKWVGDGLDMIVIGLGVLAQEPTKR